MYSPMDFTTAQRRILDRLAIAGAIDRDTAVTITSPGAAAPLINGYFCAKRSRKPKGGSHQTVYWLTDRGQRAQRNIGGRP